MISPVSIVIDVATGLIAVTLLWSGLAKLRTPQLTLKAMKGLGSPSFLQYRWIASLVPVLELLLGGVLLFAPGSLRFAGATVATALFAGFTFYVARTVARGAEVACGCFGSSSAEPVDRLTVVRNVLLTACGVFAMLVGVTGPSLVLTVEPLRITVFAVTILFALIVMFATKQHRHINRLRGIINQREDRYARASDEPLTGTPIPDAELVSASGITVTLPQLGNGRAVLLIFSKAGCGDCAQVARSLPSWEDTLQGVVNLVIVTSSKPERLFSEYPEFVGRTYFGANAARKALGIRILPTAVLLAADAQSIATEVVEGSDAISKLVAAIHEQVLRPTVDHESDPGEK